MTPVGAYVAGLDAATSAMVTQLRALALVAAPGINERIKWKAPSFGPGDDDRITLGLDPKGGVRVILHRGATAKADAGFRFDDPSGLIRWAAPDRGVLGFRTAAEIDAARSEIADIFTRWLAATN